MPRLPAAVLVVVAVVSSGCPRRPSEASHYPDATPRDPEAEIAHDRALALAIGAGAGQPPLTDEPCPIKTPLAPIPLGEMSLDVFHDRLASNPGDATYGYLLFYLRLIGSEVEVVPAPDSHAPFGRAGFDDPKVTLVIDHFEDPGMTEGAKTFRPGSLDGTVLVWDAKARAFVCGAHVSVSNGDLTVVRTVDDNTITDTREDPLSKARVDLVNEALRAGLANPVRLAPAPAAPDGGAAAPRDSH